ncbi:FAD-binding domain-containing protein [Amniculicola lignicola CBS 123094]|uniref:FAD-binding domain-containing protein n=1 Tax=Amniculicola lignicola CBS 123094 TaxID=1392246 RepID=A0A6A5WJK5_9PLEO|nr:FAD-binding domain-containing protein [Amniculicola lignicola CBS 123094]
MFFSAFFFYLITPLFLSHTRAPYCLPNSPCFPLQKELQKLNASVDGRLIKAELYGKACYKGSYDEEECRRLAGVKTDFHWRDGLAAGLMHTNWEQDNQNRGCPIPDLPSDGTSPVPVDGKCELGGMSSYVVNASSVEDIQKAVKFAAKYNLRFRVKNTGHCYTGRSSGKGSFSVWTRHMNDAKFEKGWKACSGDQKQNVISAGPGVNVEELYAFAGKNGVVAHGGFTATVGAAGGFVLGGGTGPMGAILGMAVDTFKAVNTMIGQIGCKDRIAYKELVSRMVDLQIPLREKGQMGTWSASGVDLGVAILSVKPFTSAEQASNPNDTIEMFKPALAAPGCTPLVQANQIPTWNDVYQRVLWPIIQGVGPVGVNIAILSRLISYDLIHDQERLARVKAFIVDLPPDAPFLWQNAVGEATHKISPDATAIHPDWRNAFAFMDVAYQGPWQGVTAHQTATAQAILNNATAVFGTTAYYNENWKLEENFRVTNWGRHYERLLGIKKEVDPRGLFACRDCVGSEIWGF